MRARRKAVGVALPPACESEGKPGANTSWVAAELSALKKRADLAFRSARGAVLQFLRNLFSPFHTSLPLLMYSPLFVLLCLAAPTIAAGQNSPPSDKRLSTVQTQMRNVRYHFSDAVVVEIKSLNGELVPVGNNEFPIFDDKNSFSLRISAARSRLIRRIWQTFSILMFLPVRTRL